MDGISVSLVAGAVGFAAFMIGLTVGAGSLTNYDKFTAECTQSTIETQYVEQHGKRAMVVQCERVK